MSLLGLADTHFLHQTSLGQAAAKESVKKHTPKRRLSEDSKAQASFVAKRTPIYPGNTQSQKKTEYTKIADASPSSSSSSKSAMHGLELLGPSLQESGVNTLDRLTSLKKDGPLIFTFEELQQDLLDLGDKNFGARMSNLIQLCLEKNEHGKKEFYFWITLQPKSRTTKGVYLKIMLCKGDYYSEAKNVFKKSIAGPHYYLEAYESIGESGEQGKQVLLMRFSHNGGELIRVEKGNQVTGKEAIKVAQLFRDHSKLPAYIYDDATLQISPNKKILLKSLAIGDAAGQTWYQRHLSNLALAPGSWTLPCGTVVDQTKYPAALEFIRNCRISKVWEFFKTTNDQKKFLSLITKAFDPEFKKSGLTKEAFVEQCKKTIHDLTAAVIQLAKNAKGPEALQLQYALHTLVIEPCQEIDFFTTPIKSNRELVNFTQKYWNCIRIISDSRIFIWKNENPSETKTK